MQSESPQVRPLSIGVFGVRGIPSTYSGYETFATVFLPELASRGHDVTLYVRGGEREQPDYRGVHRIGLPTWKTKQLDTISHGIVAAREVKKRADHDVVLAFNVANALMLAPLTRSGTPTVLNVDGQEWLRDKWGWLGKQAFRRSASISKRCATSLVTDCHAMRKIYLRRFDAESVVIPYCWTDLLAAPEDHRTAAAVLESYGLSDRGYVVAGGRMVPENNIGSIVSSLVRSDLDLDIAVLGTANYDSPVVAEIREHAALDSRVKILGHISDRYDFATLLCHAAAYMHGHSVGGINPSLVEAMGAGAQICAYDTPFNREALGDTGSYFTDPNQAIQQAGPLQRPDDDWERFRDEAKKRVHEVFSLDRITTLYEEALQAAVSNAR